MRSVVYAERTANLKTCFRDPEYDDEQFKRNRNNFSFTMNWPRDPFFSMMEDFMEGFSQNNIFVEQFPSKIYFLHKVLVLVLYTRSI